jgi:pimeloyl-ACP methyl ester carboxylesterase
MSEVTLSDGCPLHYTEVGQGEPLLLIMGFGMPGEAWLGSLPFLEGFRVIYYDNRGTGQSGCPEGAYTIPRMAEDAAELLDHLGIARAHVYGISMGGMIAQELALTHPEKIRSLVLGCTLCGGSQSKLAEPEILDALVEVVSNIGKPDPASWAERQLPLLFPADWVAANPGIRDMLAAIVPLVRPTPPSTAQNLMAGIFEWGTYDRLPQLDVPTLIVHGDSDVLIPVENAYTIAERISGSKLHIISGAGHGYPVQDPVGVHETITEFLRAH